MIIGIDGTYVSSGGSLSQFIEIINYLNPREHKFKKIIIWAPELILNYIYDKRWIQKEEVYSKNKLIKFFSNIFIYRNLKLFKCDILLVFGGTSFHSFQPKVLISQNLLPFDNKVLKKYLLNYEIFNYVKFNILKFLQVFSFNKANGIIFFHKYTKNKIIKFIKHRNYKIIPPLINIKKSKHVKKEIICYVTNYQLYKNDLEVVKALDIFLNTFNYKAYFIGNQKEKNFYIVRDYLLNSKIKNKVQLINDASYKKVIKFMEKTKVFLFASSCESFPVSLLEAIMTKNFILSSNKEPMKSILGKKAIYFDETNHKSIYSGLLKYNKLNQIYKKKIILSLFNEKKKKHHIRLITSSIFDYLKLFLK
jgi:hypothetical protein